MITQGIKRWLNKLFAWWPWKSTSETSYILTVSNLNMSVAQDTLTRTTDGSVPQPGITSVVVEQEREEISPESFLSTNENLAGRFPQSGLPLSSEIQKPQLSDQPASILQEHTLQEHTHDEQAALILEHKLTFLKYLVSQGRVNEGFEEGQTPEQYRRF